MDLNNYLKLSPEVADALRTGKPLVALESTIISHGMPYPQNVKTALECERVCRENGAVPATCAIIGGKLCAGLTAEEIDYALAKIPPVIRNLRALSPFGPDSADGDRCLCRLYRRRY